MILSALLAAIAATSLAVAAASRRRANKLQSRVDAVGVAMERMQLAFHRFVPSLVVEDVLARGLTTEAQKREVTILFADLRGFTTLSETLDPAELVDILNGYFRAMSAAIAAHRGHLSKFMGDGLMALFGAMDHNPWQSNDAVTAALAMRSALEKYNEQLRSRGRAPLSFGVGIHRGVAVCGLIGTDELMEFTVIGDAVNLAARLESQTRVAGKDILLTEEVKASLDPRFRLQLLPPFTVKGRASEVRAYAVEGTDPT